MRLVIVAFAVTTTVFAASSGPKFSPPVVALTFDHYNSTYRVAFPIMQKYGLVGTYYVDPRFIDREVDGISASDLRTLQRNGWEIGIYTGTSLNVVRLKDGYVGVRKWLVELKHAMKRKGFRSISLAPASRAWPSDIRSAASDLFTNVRVARNQRHQTIPVVDPMNVDGSGRDSLSAADTTASLSRVLDDLETHRGLEIVIVHKVGDDADPIYSISAKVFEQFCAAIAERKREGRLRDLSFSRAIKSTSQ